MENECKAKDVMHIENDHVTKHIIENKWMTTMYCPTL